MLVSVPLRVPRFACAALVAASAVTAVTALTLAGEAIPNVITAHVMTFYAVTAGAYAALPFVRRGDIVMAGVWMVLAAGVGPCVLGREISAPLMFSDMAGVLMAAAPIYIARLRQLAQGDMRHAPRRRKAEG